jgi:hypothetical protein
MTAPTIILTVLCVFSVAAGCNRAENSSEVRRDVTEARQEANEQVADARKAAADTTADAKREVVDELQNAKGKVTDANREVAMARIDGELKVAKERCEALSGDVQKACKDKVEADYDLAKRQVDSTFMN